MITASANIVITLKIKLKMTFIMMVLLEEKVFKSEILNFAYLLFKKYPVIIGIN